jgi:hypothetical protein
MLNGILWGARRLARPYQYVVYARHGRELMGLKSPVSVPVLGLNLTLITSLDSHVSFLS